MLAGYACQRCGRAKATDAHHLTYERLGRERDGDLLARARPATARCTAVPAGADAGRVGGRHRSVDTPTLRMLWLAAVDAPWPRCCAS